MASDVEHIKAKLDIVELIRSYLSLQPAGKNFKALCPFHQEKTPSFIVSPDRQLWHCFGCGEGGDGIKFLMRYENLEFPEALRVLAERVGVELQSLSSREQREYGVLFDIHDAASKFYQGELARQPDALGYLRDRGLSDDTVREFELGFATGGESLTVHLLRSGFDVGSIARAGLAQKNTAGLYRDRFGGRIVFPIASAVGKTVAFTGRLLPAVAAANPDAPKYLNSPETPIYQKSKILYGFHRSKGDIARERAAVVVEGQMDLLLAWQAGVHHVVAVSGTGLTSQHLDRLRRLADTVLMSFDNDDAGVRALERSLETLTPFDFHVRVIDLGQFKDPAEAAQQEPGFLSRAIQEARPAFAHLFAHYFSGGEPGKDIAARKRTVRHLLGMVQRLKSAVEQAAWIKALASHSGVSEVALLAELTNLPRAKREWSGLGEAAEAPKAVERIEVVANRLLILAFTDDRFLATLRERQSWLPSAYQRLVQNPASGEADLFHMQASHLAESGDVAGEFEELLRQLNLERLKREQAAIRDEMRRAEQRGDEATHAGALERFKTIAGEINKLTVR